jgi:hypothetical protein
MKIPVATPTTASETMATPAYLALVPGAEHPLRVRDREHEKRNRDEDPERQVQQKHRVEEGRVAGEGRDENRVGGDQPERHEEQPVEAPLPGPQNAGGPGRGSRHPGGILRGQVSIFRISGARLRWPDIGRNPKNRDLTPLPGMEPVP